MSQRALLFGVHMHQPVDNFDFCVQEAIEKSYKPFFETMSHYPEFKFAVHSSGWLLEQIEMQSPKLFTLMQDLTQKGSIEWFSAGFYEPVLSSIPSKDRKAQIKQLNKYLSSRFKVKAKGLWLTERVWESSLVPDIAACGIEYSVVDDYHFISSGFSKEHLAGYYKTEEAGEQNALFPISKDLRYVFPFSSVDKAIDTVLSTSVNGAAIFFDDAEKFGLWPNTYEWVYEQKWLENFVTAVLAHSEIVSMHYGEYYQNHKSHGLAYLNNTSYIEMGEWSLDAKAAQEFRHLKAQVGEEYFEKTGIAFIKGGIWKNFFVKYTESNYLHKRMLHLSKQSKFFSKAQKNSLYKLQTNDVFWHGVFGGIYLPNLRDNAYKYLLEIEKELEDEKIQLFDIDNDGFDELKIKTQKLSLAFSSRYGGQMMEFGSFESFFNWQNTMTRREEVYHLQDETHEHSEQIDSIHDGVAMDEALRHTLRFDPSPRYSFIDHFTCSKGSLEDFKNLNFHDIGDFACEPFEIDANNQCFTREGRLLLDTPQDAALKKRYSCKGNGIILDISFSTAHVESLFYVCEFNFHFAHLYDITLNEKKIGDGISVFETKNFALYDAFTCKQLEISSKQLCDAHAYVVSTVAKSESGFDKTPQHITLILIMKAEPNMQICLKVQDV